MTSFLFETGWHPKNRRPDENNRLPECPRYQLIDICARFTRLDIKSPKFCGYIYNPFQSFNGPFNMGREIIGKQPYSMCISVRDKLNDYFRIINEQSYPCERQNILDLWREGVYNFFCVPGGVDGNHHFSPVRMEDLTDEFVINTVLSFKDFLEVRVTGKGYLDEARFCPQHPSFSLI